jgi:hypothetical protein
MSVLEQLMAEIQSAQDTKAYGGGRNVMQRSYNKAGLSGSVPSLPYMHGPGGLFSTPGLERDVISTRIHPYGLASDLPASGTVVMNPLYPYLTSFAAPTGSNPNGVCDDPMEAGPVSACLQTAQFGLYSFRTRTIDITQNGRQVNRGEFLDLRVMNDPLLDTGGNGITQPNVNGSPDLTREVLQRFVEVGISFQDKLTRALYNANPANNTAGGGYKEFPGLDILIGVNKYDAISGTACPSLDSDIKDFAYGKLGTGTNDTQVVNAMSYLMRYLSYNADHMNLGPCEWSIVMRPELFWELTAAWPCAYMTYRCQNFVVGAAGNNPLFIDANDQLRMRDDMRNNNYLLIDGIKYPVILDVGIHEDSNTTSNKVSSGCFSSDIYVVPRVIRGGLVATYWEYVDYQQTAMVAAEDGRAAIDFWTDGGRYLWHKQPPANWCIQWVSRIEPRVILRTPQLAGRLNNVQYCPLQHTREPYTDEPYFVGGGTTSRPGPSLYSDWSHP